MSDYVYETLEGSVVFEPDTGIFSAHDQHEGVDVVLPKREAINLASKLLQWGTSS